MEDAIQKKRRKKRRRRIILTILFLVVIAAVVIGVRMKGTMAPEDMKGPLSSVEYGGVLDRLTETGTIELVRSIEVKSKISGKIKQILVEEGEIVSANQLMAIVEPDPNQALQLYGKRAAVERARIEYLEREKEWERNQSLFEKDLIARQELEKFENLYRLAKNAFKQAQLEQQILEMEMTEATPADTSGLDTAEIMQLDDFRIVAPISGLVIARNVEQGEMVVTGISSYMVGTTVFQIGDPSEMIVKSSISEVDLGRLREGQEVLIVADSYPDDSYTGRVKSIAPVGLIKQGESIVTFEVEIEILDPDERLRQGMSCDIDIVMDRRENVLVLPVEAVHEVMRKDIEGEETSEVDHVLAYRWKAEDFEEIRIELGLQSSNRVEILSGLNDGDEVSREAGKKYKEFRDKEAKVQTEAETPEKKEVDR
ncbi:MAG: efflux RND transporter periplasmic adaptor subunit [Candidatus Aminicenantaceae bacterium]